MTYEFFWSERISNDRYYDKEIIKLLESKLR
jgi:hypothetical protein